MIRKSLNQFMPIKKLREYFIFFICSLFKIYVKTLFLKTDKIEYISHVFVVSPTGLSFYVVQILAHGSQKGKFDC